MLISVIVPVYNSSSYLGDCIKSILNQTLKDFELILVDDGSTDNSLEECLSWSSKDNRIIVIHQDNSGASKARNKGIKSSHGDWIIFVDSDDTVHPSYLADLYQSTCKHPNVDLCISGLQVVRNGENKESICFPDKICKISDYKTLFGDLSLNESGFSVGKLYRKEIIDSNQIYFNNKVSIAEDCLFMINYIIACSKNRGSNIVFIHQCNYNYIIRKGSLSNSISSYEEERYNFNEYKEAIIKLCDTFCIEYEIRYKLYKSLPYYIDRIINSIYKDSLYKERIKKLKTINIDIYKKHKECKTLIEYMLYFLLTYRCWFLYDCIRKKVTKK